MAAFDTTVVETSRTPLLATLWTAFTAPFRAIGSGLISVAESSSRMDLVRELNAKSDADLAAEGTNRANEVRRIFASCGAI